MNNRVSILGQFAPRWIVFSLLLMAQAGLAQAFDLMVSSASSRSPASLLEGGTVSGNIYVFTTPETGASRVSFFIDGSTTANKIEGVRPYDLAGTAADGSAFPFNTAALSDGLHTLRAAVLTSSGTTETITAQFTVGNTVTPPPSLIFAPASTAFSATAGSNPPIQSATLSTSNGSATTYGITVSYDVGGSTAWLIATPTSSISSSSVGVNLAVNATGLPAGTYTATVNATASGYTAVSLPVTLTVTSATSPYELRMSKTSDRASAVSLDGQTVAGQIYAFTTPETGVKSVSFFLDGATTAYKTEGVKPYDLAGTAANGSALPFNTASLSDGIHTLKATITTLTSATPENVTAQFTVKNAVTPSAALIFSPASATFTASSGSNPAAQGVTLSTSNGSAATSGINVTYGAGASTGWLTATPTSSVPSSSLGVNLTVNTTGLPVGTYSATVSANASGFTAASLPVTLTVTAASSGYELRMSKSSNRASPVTLDGQTVAGQIYVFTGPDTNVRRVTFFLDGAAAAYRIEGLGPFDFAGTAASGAAQPFNTATLTDGNHFVTANIELTTGAVQSVTAQFTVSNNSSVPTYSSDNFNDGDYTGWTMFDDSLAVPSNWIVTGGQLVQTAEVGNYGTALLNAYHKGTYAIFDATRGLENYRFQVTATPQSDLGRDIGVMFRFVNNDNYYRLYFSADDGGVRLERKLGGVFTTLAKNARGYKANVPITITIEAKGSLFQVGVNGDDQLFGFYDANLQAGAVALYCRHACAFDDVSVDLNSGATSLVIAKPEAYSVATGGTLNVSAILMNKPVASTAQVQFSLDGVACTAQPTAESQAAPGLFQAQCAAPLNVHVQDLTAQLLLNGQTTAFSDTNVQIGSRGANFLAIGDSITFGLGDDFNADNSELDGWVQNMQGYEAPLTGALNQLHPETPTIIFNSGFPGDRAQEVLGRGRLDAALEKYSDADQVLVMLGTNEVGTNVPSGLDCSGTACAGTFKANMLEIIRRIRNAGKKPFVARIPPRFGDSETTLYSAPESHAKNLKAQEMNRVISEQLGLAPDEIGPDFYDAFLGAGVNRFSLFVDTLHPNALGYSLMAQLWYNHFSGDNGMPFLLDAICVRVVNQGGCVSPSTYKQNAVGVGDPYYADANYTITGYATSSVNHPGELPAEIAGGVWVMTNNGDKSLANSDYLTLNFGGSATVYVAYDDGGAKPNWLTSGFVDTGMRLTTSNAAAAPSMRLYRKTSVTAPFTLLGNMATGASGTPENYLVIVKPN